MLNTVLMCVLYVAVGMLAVRSEGVSFIRRARTLDPMVVGFVPPDADPKSAAVSSMQYPQREIFQS